MNRASNVRYKVFTSFAMSVLAVIVIVRLLATAPPSWHTAGAYATAGILALAAFWRGLIFARMARAGSRS